MVRNHQTIHRNFFWRNSLHAAEYILRMLRIPVKTALLGILAFSYSCTLFKAPTLPEDRQEVTANPDLALFLISEQKDSSAKVHSDFLEFISGLYPAVPLGFVHRKPKGLDAIEFLKLEKNEDGSTNSTAAKKIVVAIEVDQLKKSHIESFASTLQKVLGNPTSRSLIVYINYCTSTPDSLEVLDQFFNKTSSGLKANGVRHIFTAGGSCQQDEYISSMMQLTWYEKMSKAFLWENFTGTLLNKQLFATTCDKTRDTLLLSQGAFPPKQALFSFLVGELSSTEKQEHLVGFQNKISVKNCVI